MKGIQQQKDNGYPGQYIFLAPPNKTELEARLRKRGLDTEVKITEKLTIADKELEQAKVEGFHDKIITNDDLDAAFKELEEFIFGSNDETMKENVEDDTQVTKSADVDMTEETSPVANNVEEPAAAVAQVADQGSHQEHVPYRGHRL